MNNYPIPYIPQQINYPAIFNDINKLKQEIKLLEERISKLESNNDKNYLKKDDNYYMI